MSNIHWASIIAICLTLGTALGGVTHFGIKAAGRSLARMGRDIATEVVKSQLDDFKVDVNRRFDANDIDSRVAARKSEALELELARQFGGNSNGLRQAVNALSSEVATLAGRFEEHTRGDSARA